MIFKRLITEIVFQKIYSSGGKQTIHNVSAAFIVKNCHPPTSLKNQRMMLQCQGAMISYMFFVRQDEMFDVWPLQIYFCSAFPFLSWVWLVHNIDKNYAFVMNWTTTQLKFSTWV